MNDMKDLLIQAIEENAMRRVGNLANQLVHADSRVKELTLAEIEFQRFLAESCLDCRAVR